MTKCTRKKTYATKTHLKTKTLRSTSPHFLDEWEGREAAPGDPLPRPNPGCLQPPDLPLAVMPCTVAAWSL